MSFRSDDKIFKKFMVTNAFILIALYGFILRGWGLAELSCFCASIQKKVVKKSEVF